MPKLFASRLFYTLCLSFKIKTTSRLGLSLANDLIEQLMYVGLIDKMAPCILISRQVINAESP